MKNKSFSLTKAPARLRPAHYLYSELTNAIREAVAAVSGNPPDSEKARAANVALRIHSTALTKLISTELELEEGHPTIARHPAQQDLDLDAARAEVRKRLAKLADAKRGGDLP